MFLFICADFLSVQGQRRSGKPGGGAALTGSAGSDRDGVRRCSQSRRGKVAIVVVCNCRGALRRPSKEACSSCDGAIVFSHDTSHLFFYQQVNADGLLAVVEKKALGEVVSAEDVVEVQREVQKQKQLQRAQKDVQRVLQNASESENQLGVALKVSRLNSGRFLTWVFCTTVHMRMLVHF